jgi:hypothetical protein
MAKSSRPAAETQDAPTPLVAPPQPMSTGVLKIQRQRTRDWIAAGGVLPP